MNIAMLRLWLSLAIEYEGDKPEPLPNLDFKLPNLDLRLPNLDFKIVCEDSLLGPDPSPESVPDLFRDLADRLNLGALKAQYMKRQRRERQATAEGSRSPLSRRRCSKCWATLGPWTGASGSPRSSQRITGSTS